jgi:hypothetical protein
MTSDVLAVPAHADAKATLRELRRTRQRRRLGETDWYDIAYRVYLFALVGLVVVVWVSDAIDGAIGDSVDTQDLLTRGPAIIGLMVVVAFGLGLRSGADGGPISIEVADIRHVLLAPISQRSVMLRPIGQRLRSAAFALGLAGAVLGQLIATEVEGSRAAWAAACGVFGAIVGSTFVATAVSSHALRVPRWAATLVATVLVAWQGLVAWGIWNDSTDGLARVGPGNLAGRLALWGISQRGVDVLAIVVAVAMAAAALALGGHLRLEPLARRGELVSQLRFAATVQDLRTVVQLRRQLRSEVLRTRQWGERHLPDRPAPETATRAHRRPTATSTNTPTNTPTNTTTTTPSEAVSKAPTRTPSRTSLAATPAVRPRPSVVWRRGSRSLRRLPLARLLRIALLAALAGLGGALTYDSSPLFGLVLLGALFLVGLESLEPLSQEVDRPDLTDGYPIERGWIFANHLLAPAVFLVGVAIIAAGTATAIDPSLALGAFVIAVPMAWAGAMGGVVVTVLDAPSAPSTTTLLGTPRDAETSFVPPEFAGFSTVITAMIPVVVSAVGTIPVFVARFTDDAASVGRSIVGLALFIAAAVVWVRRRDPWTAKIRNFFEEGRAAAS